MKFIRQHLNVAFFILPVFMPVFLGAQNAESDIDKMVEIMLAPTPIAEDLHELCDKIGGRVTGTKANERAVTWAMKKFEKAGVLARKEAFPMPEFWNEKVAKAAITGVASFKPRIVSRAFSAPTPDEGLFGELVVCGYGTEADFAKQGARIKDKFILVKTDELKELSQLFKEYSDAMKIETIAAKAGVKGVVYMSSRPKKLLFRHLASKTFDNTLPLIVMARDDATRCVRILERGHSLDIGIKLDLETGGQFTSHNVIGEIKGSKYPKEVVLVGAHLDSWGLGTGANDNGCNVSMMIDMARQMKKHEIQPERTIRFALWNGEEQGMNGSFAYTMQHENELDKHVIAISIDIGSGKINGYFTGARPEVFEVCNSLVSPISDLGPFENLDVPLVGTDNFDFMMQGVPNLVGKHEGANYCSDYHCESDTYDKVNLENLKTNSAIVAATILGFANLPGNHNLLRQSRQQVQSIVDSTNLAEQLKAFNYWDGWLDGSRGRNLRR